MMDKRRKQIELIESNLNEFENFLNQIEDEEAEGYSHLSDEELITFIVDRLWLTFQCILKILTKHRVSEDAYDGAVRIAQSPKNEEWLCLYRLHRDRRPIEQLVKWHWEVNDMDREISRRLRKRPIGRTILRIEQAGTMTGSDRSELLKLLVRKRDLKSYRHEYDSKDLEQIALDEFYKIHRRLKNRVRLSIAASPPPFPKDLGLPVASRPYFYRNRATDLMKRFLPILRGDYEKYRAKPGWISPVLKEFFAKHGYVRDDDSEHDDACETRLFYEATDFDFLDQQFARYYPSEIAKQLSDALRKIKRKESRRKLLLALEYCYNRKTERQACRLAGITPRTFRNHFPRTLRAFLLQHSPRLKPYYRRLSVNVAKKQTSFTKSIN